MAYYDDGAFTSEIAKYVWQGGSDCRLWSQLLTRHANGERGSSIRIKTTRCNAHRLLPAIREIDLDERRIAVQQREQGISCDYSRPLWLLWEQLVGQSFAVLAHPSKQQSCEYTTDIPSDIIGLDACRCIMELLLNGAMLWHGAQCRISSANMNMEHMLDSMSCVIQNCDSGRAILLVKSMLVKINQCRSEGVCLGRHDEHSWFGSSPWNSLCSWQSLLGLVMERYSTSWMLWGTILCQIIEIIYIIIDTSSLKHHRHCWSWYIQQS